MPKIEYVILTLDRYGSEGPGWYATDRPGVKISEFSQAGREFAPSLAALLNQYGQHGWDLVTATGKDGINQLLFKRAS